MANLQLFAKGENKLKYRQIVQAAEQLMKLQSAEKEYNENESEILGCLGGCYNGPETDWEHVSVELDRLDSYHQNNPLSFCSIYCIFIMLYRS